MTDGRPPRDAPASLLPPKLVYLDVNQWVALARANTGHRDGEPVKHVKHVLEACDQDAFEEALAL